MCTPEITTPMPRTIWMRLERGSQSQRRPHIWRQVQSSDQVEGHCPNCQHEDSAANDG